MSNADEAVVRRFYEELCNGRKNDIAPELFTADHKFHGTPSASSNPRRCPHSVRGGSIS